MRRIFERQAYRGALGPAFGGTDYRLRATGYSQNTSIGRAPASVTTPSFAASRTTESRLQEVLLHLANVDARFQALDDFATRAVRSRESLERWKIAYEVWRVFRSEYSTRAGIFGRGPDEIDRQIVGYEEFLGNWERALREEARKEGTLARGMRAPSTSPVPRAPVPERVEVPVNGDFAKRAMTAFFAPRAGNQITRPFSTALRSPYAASPVATRSLPPTELELLILRSNVDLQTGSRATVTFLAPTSLDAQAVAQLASSQWGFVAAALPLVVRSNIPARRWHAPVNLWSLTGIAVRPVRSSVRDTFQRCEPGESSSCDDLCAAVYLASHVGSLYVNDPSDNATCPTPFTLPIAVVTSHETVLQRAYGGRRTR